VIASNAGSFDPNNSNTYFNETIIALNIIPYENIPNAPFIDQNTYNDLIEESEMAQEMNTRFPLDIANFLLNSENMPHVVNKLLNNVPLTKLYYAIVIEDVNLLKTYLRTIDPRDDDNRAYTLAVNLDNPKIIEAVKDSIIRRNLLEQTAIGKMSQFGTKQPIQVPPPSVLHQLTRQRL
jgi:hypothetical protein